MLSPEALKNIASSKYVGSPYTFVDRICDYLFWEPTLQLLPLWLAPNLITFLGSICMFVACALSLVYNNATMTAELPPYVWLVAVAALTAYDTLDNTDGKQARRTKSSSPLGQLLDHGFDSSVNTNAICFLLIQALQVTNTTYSVLMLLMMEATYLMAAWEEHYVGSCRTSLAGVGVTEYGIITRVIFFVTWWKGYAFWKEPLIWDVSRSDAFALFTIGIGLWTMVSILVMVLYRTKSLRPLRDLLPLCVFSSTVGFFISKGTIKYYTMPLMLCTASVLGEMATALIISTMAKMEYPLVHKGLLIYVFQAIITATKGTHHSGHHSLGLWFYVFIAALQIFLQVKSFITWVLEISTYLNIPVFKIKPKTS